MWHKMNDDRSSIQVYADLHVGSCVVTPRRVIMSNEAKAEPELFGAHLTSEGIGTFVRGSS